MSEEKGRPCWLDRGAAAVEALRAAGAMEHTTVVSCAPKASLAERYAATAAVRGEGWNQEGDIVLACVLCVECASRSLLRLSRVESRVCFASSVKFFFRLRFFFSRGRWL